MNKLIELHKQSRTILPDLRNAQLQSSRNLDDQNVYNKLMSLQMRWDEIMREIEKEEHNLIQTEFGNDTLSEWIEYKELDSSQYLMNSEVGQRVSFLKQKLVKVQEVIDRAKFHMG